MKKNLLSFLFIFVFIFYSNAQILYSTAFTGGDNGSGTINSFIPATNELAVTKSFESFAANPYYTNLIQASNGKLYGMTFNGGSNGNGIIFSWDPVSGAYLKLKDFSNLNSEGSNPTGSLIQAKNGLLYGMTPSGGNYGVGVIFSFNIANNVYTKLYDFDNSNGANPQGSLIQGKDGKLYGLANGGNNGNGVIFSFDASSLIFKKLYEYDYINGAFPEGSLLQAANGKLYGMTNNGGSNDVGVMFSFNISSSVYTKLKDFDTTGGYPYGSLIQAKNGKLYGMTFGGGGGYGFIFSFNPANTNYSVLKHFDSSNGGNPYGSLLQANDGNLYGITSYGGANNDGTIFSFKISNATYTKLKDFDNNSGSGSLGSPIQGTDGRLYGMTFQGGISNDGVMFSFDASGNVYTKLKDFATNVTGYNPSAAMIKTANNKLYGMASSGGKNNKGTIFSFDPFTSTYTSLKDFDSIDGINPYGSLIQAADGKLYGMTTNGGANNYGVIFSFDPATLQYTKMKDFNYTNGANPYGSLVQAIDGKLYGMASKGGSKGYGVIFSFDPLTGIYKKKDFNNNNGAYPYGSLIQASDGKLYGMTSDGGKAYIQMGHKTGAGVIFSYNPFSSVYTKLKEFDYYHDGGFAYGSFIQANNGKLYAMNSQGGITNAGVIFSYDPALAVYTVLNDFDVTNGGDPYGNLMQASDGKLYGNTKNGGDNGTGVVFSFNLVNAIYSKLADYNVANGANPYYGSGFVEVINESVLPIKKVSFSGGNLLSNNKLSWKVANEQKVSYYKLQRSIDGKNFTDISLITPSGSNSYSYNDNVNTVIPSVYYYRLKSVDIDGNFTYSNVVQLSRNSNESVVAVFPNPFKNNLSITINSLNADKVIFILSDVNGKQLYKETKQLYAGTNVVSINETSGLVKGTYFLTIITQLQSQTIKLVKGD